MYCGHETNIKLILHEKKLILFLKKIEQSKRNKISRKIHSLEKFGEQVSNVIFIVSRNSLHAQN